MEKNRLSASELALAELIWRHAPVPSGELVHLCAREFDWKKSTTYTQLKRLESYGVVAREDAVVTPRITREQYQERQSVAFVEHTFGGSLPAFLAAFTRGKKLSERQIGELKRMIDEYEGGEQ